MQFKNIFRTITMVACLTLFATSCTPSDTAEEDKLFEQNIDKTRIKVPPTGIDKTRIKVPPNG
ncbi:hypothetical protein KCTC52924_03151 [Arenibacter antarcticus]|uniref:hypothetical protein n=1 Tax=Arenibacter sp. H213 TaxID=2183743 RepID=UPI002042CFC5|nr:hypothetical protein [Arenibacter sp. H213]MCM4166227.1 hypothetical protein [Arenibacter sp. H213]